MGFFIFNLKLIIKYLIRKTRKNYIKINKGLFFIVNFFDELQLWLETNLDR
jgi:hypothetical protein